MLSHVRLLATPRTYTPLNSPGQNTGVGSCSLLGNPFWIGIFPIQGLNPGLLHCGRILYQLSHQRSPKVKVTQSCSTLCNPVDCSLPGSSVHGILQTRILEWVGISFSKSPLLKGIPISFTGWSGWSAEGHRKLTLLTLSIPIGSAHILLSSIGQGAWFGGLAKTETESFFVYLLQ